MQVNTRNANHTSYVSDGTAPPPFTTSTGFQDVPGVADALITDCSEHVGSFREINPGIEKYREMNPGIFAAPLT